MRLKKVNFIIQNTYDTLLVTTNDKVKLWCIMLPKMSGYAESFDETKYISFLIKDEELLKNTIKSGIKSEIVLKKDLIANQCIMKDI